GWADSPASPARGRRHLTTPRHASGGHGGKPRGQDTLCHFRFLRQIGLGQRQFTSIPKGQSMKKTLFCAMTIWSNVALAGSWDDAIKFQGANYPGLPPNTVTTNLNVIM